MQDCCRKGSYDWEMVGLRIVYISMNTLGLNCLDELLKQNADIAAIFTLDEKFSKNVSDFESFDSIAKENAIPLYKVENINDETNLAKMKELQPGMVFAIGWSQILSKELLQIPENGCVGMHPSLLPRNRGRAAIPWQILMHERESGLSFFYLGQGVDNGPIIAQKKFALNREESATSFYEKIVGLGRQIMGENLRLLEEGKAPAAEQDESKATYLEKRKPENGLIDWSKSSQEAYDLIRATARPYPGAFTHYHGKKLVVWRASVEKGDSFKTRAGQILAVGEQGATVACGKGVVLLKEVEFGNCVENPGRVLKVGELCGMVVE